MREGDILVLCALDRLGRNYQDILKWWRYITQELKCSIIVLDMPVLNTQDKGDLDRGFITELMLQLLSYIAERERLAIKERQRQGIEAAKARGVRLGRPPIEPPENSDEVVKQWRAKNITAVEAMRQLKLSKYAFYKLIKKEVSV